MDVVQSIASEQKIAPRQVAAVLTLLNDGGTVPFIARYRKERTGGLDEVQIRAVTERFEYLTELQLRRESILKSIEEQEKLTPALAKKIADAQTKQALEDLYLPYKKKRRTRASIARERGLEPLAGRMLDQQDSSGEPALIAKDFVNPGKDVADVEAALAGARDIVAEGVSEDAELRALVRAHTWAHGLIKSEAAPKKKSAKSKFEKYYEHSEPIKKIPSHRYLAVRRGEKEGFLKVTVSVDEEKVTGLLLERVLKKGATLWKEQLTLAVSDSYKRLMAPSIASDVRETVKLASDDEAIEVFADNLRHLLLAAPMGGKRLLAIDPGFRTGCKVAAIDATGKLLAHDAIFPHPPQKEEDGSRAKLEALLAEHNSEAVAIGDGTAGRETHRFVAAFLKERHKTKDTDKKPLIIMVNEAGASVYSASALAREELPKVDVTVRGAVSIGRRLQDPLAELVKIDPRSIGVGQYQHDVNQQRLKKKLDDVVESSVNHVGVDVNTASRSLLAHVAGIGQALARRIVAYREKNGAFADRTQLAKVPMFGPKAFEQAAGFLRVPSGVNPLDNSAVHPERYELVAQMAADLEASLADLVGSQELVGKIDVKRYESEDVGAPTLLDIIEELKKPGRDPRAEFTGPIFRDDVNEIADLKDGMILEGVITNVTNFGAFVDVGVHQDGLVHVSELSHKFVSDPKEIVKVGDKIKVKVVSVDAERKRISLSAKQAVPAPAAPPRKKRAHRSKKKGAGKRPVDKTPRDDRPRRGRRGPDTSLGALLGDALKDALDD